MGKLTGDRRSKEFWRVRDSMRDSAGNVMGTMIHLAVGNLEIDWGKNHGFTDHSALFQPGDLTKVPYKYADGDTEHVDAGGQKKCDIATEWKEALSSPLGRVIDRIRLLGHTVESARKEFEYACQMASVDPSAISFDDLRNALQRIDVKALNGHYETDFDTLGEFFRSELVTRLGLREVFEKAAMSSFEIGEAMENLSAYSILTLLAENASTKDLPVIWHFKDHEESGWARRSDYMHQLEAGNRFLIVTEGSSDALIVRRAFELLMPHVADFFHYVDMQEGYPFSGTGNVYRFVQGLISIAVQNKVLVLFDNDAEGSFGFIRCNELRVPANMRILKLPDLEAFSGFKTVGPSGEAIADINGKAAAIECYLDLANDPVVRWSSFHREAGAYQGELVNKDAYKKRFLEQTSRVASYDYSRLLAVLKNIVASSVTMSEAMQVSFYEDLLAEDASDSGDASPPG
ncbi:MAG TPA: HEPN/Toprim-associated domain-containing protein [Opitutaceae bacterium]|nr:HEPN/Toprim-associated domain-containing protein [Opitutaceae bacterium]